MTATPGSSEPPPAPRGRIVFPGSPWPAGHAVEEFQWSARIDPATGLWFDLHLKSVDYDAEDGDRHVDEPEDDDAPNWKSRVVWNNYHACILSSTYWDEGGFRPASREKLFRFDALDGVEFVVDPLPLEGDGPLAFGIYLQGHDTTADHHIRFARSKAGRRWSVTWRGRVALTYLGGHGFEHEFEARIEDVPFDGVAMPPGTSEKRAKELLAQFVADPERFVLEEQSGVIKCKLT